MAAIFLEARRISSLTKVIFQAEYDITWGLICRRFQAHGPMYSVTYKGRGGCLGKESVEKLVSFCYEVCNGFWNASQPQVVPMFTVVKVFHLRLYIDS